MRLGCSLASEVGGEDPKVKVASAEETTYTIRGKYTHLISYCKKNVFKTNLINVPLDAKGVTTAEVENCRVCLCDL